MHFAWQKAAQASFEQLCQILCSHRHKWCLVTQQRMWTWNNILSHKFVARGGRIMPLQIQWNSWLAVLQGSLQFPSFLQHVVIPAGIRHVPFGDAQQFCDPKRKICGPSSKQHPCVLLLNRILSPQHLRGSFLNRRPLQQPVVSVL